MPRMKSWGEMNPDEQRGCFWGMEFGCAGGVLLGALLATLWLLLGGRG